MFHFMELEKACDADSIAGPIMAYYFFQLDYRAARAEPVCLLPMTHASNSCPVSLPRLVGIPTR